MWELPLSRALQYHHAALRYAGEWTVPLDVMASPAEIESTLQSLADAHKLDADDEYW